jgi:hypothetical protein
MALHREAARLRLAAIDGSAEDHAHSRAWMEAEGVRNPRAMAGLLVPGLTADPAEHVARVGSSHEACVASS